VVIILDIEQKEEEKEKEKLEQVFVLASTLLLFS
jgi:hypothetical protein